MDTKKIGDLIRTLRLEKEMTQIQLANQLHVSDKAVSKWERGQGLPDISLLGTLAEVFQIDIEKILDGCLPDSQELGGNMKKSKFYVCPSCGSVSLCTGDASLSCCGRKLEALNPKKAEEDQRLQVEKVEDEWYITSDHPMNKENYISFAAFVTGSTVSIFKQYPEWNLQFRIPKCGHGMLVWYSADARLLYQLL